MRIKQRVWLLTSVIIGTIVAADAYFGVSSIESSIQEELYRDAKDIRAMLMAMRRVYHKQFISSGLTVDDKTVGFLPAHALSRISNDFPNWGNSGLKFNNVSDRPRNPANMANKFELDAMAWFRKNPKASERFVEILDRDGKSYYHYTAPIWIEEYCLTCHGSRDHAPASIAAAYAESYDYKVGDLRGVMSIQLPTQAIRDQEYATWYRLIAMRLAGYFVLLIALGYFLNRVLTNRLASLQGTTEKFAAGDYDSRSHDRVPDEVGALAITFNRMCEDIQRRNRALVDSELRLRRLHESLRDAYAQVDMKGRLLEWNTAFQDMLGYSTNELSSLTYTDLTPAKWQAEENRIIAEQVLPYGQSDVYEKEYIRKDGSIIPVELRTFLIHGSTGQAEAMWAIVRDISKRKHDEAEQKRQKEEAETQRRRLNDILMGTNVGTWEWNVQTGETIFNEHWAEILGYSLEELEPISIDTWSKLAHPDDLKRSGELLERHFSGVLPYYEFEARMRHKDGHWVWVLDRGKVVTWTADGRPLLMSGTHQDISVRKKAEEALFENEAKFRTIFNSSLVGIGISRMSDGRFIDANDALLHMLGFVRDEFVGKTALELNIWPDPADRDSVIRQIQNRDSISGFQGKMRTKSGELRDQLLYAHSVTIAGQDCMVGMVYDNTEQKRAEHQLEELAQQDSLTTLANRRHFLGQAEQELARIKRYGGDMSLLMVDIDLFKQINDTYGHQAGDLVLSQFGQFSKMTLRGIDLVGRMGGEEFAILMPQTNSHEAVEVAERFCRSISELEVNLERGLPIRFTVSIGVVTLSDSLTNLDTLLVRADTALYEAKRTGRNKVCVYRPTLVA